MAFLGKFLNKDTSLELKDVTVNLEFLADAEERVSEFYRLCAGAMATEEDFWNSLANEELSHANNVRKMIGLITKEPKLYKPGISFGTATIRMFTLEMQRLVEQMKEGQISPDKLLGIALDIEESAVEMSYGQIVRTKDKTFNTIAHQIDKESGDHKASISARLNA